MKFGFVFFAASVLSASVALEAARAEGHETMPSDVRFYVGIQGIAGPSLNDVSYRSGGGIGTAKLGRAQMIGATAGVFLNENWRVGIDVNRFKIDLDAVTNVPAASGAAVGDVSGYNAFLDVGYETMVSDDFGVFVEGGIGFADSTADAVIPSVNENITGSDRVFVGKLGFGSTYQFNESVSLFSKYNYVFGGDAIYNSSNNGTSNADQKMHVFVTGLRFTLN